MNKYLLEGFYNELSKIAFNSRDAKRLIDVLRSSLIRRNIIEVGGRKTATKRIADGASVSTNAKGITLPGFPKDKIFIKGGTVKTSNIKEIIPKDLKPKEKEMINRIAITHEGYELAARKNNPSSVYQKIHGHVGPEVVLREGNLIAKLPKEYDRVRKVFQQARYKVDESAVRLKDIIPGYKYGETFLPKKEIKRIIAEKDITDFFSKNKVREFIDRSKPKT